MASSDHGSGYSGKSSVEQQLPITGRPLQIPKRSKKYRIDLGCSEHAKEVFERWQKCLNHYDTNASFLRQVLYLLEAEQASCR